MTRMLSLANTVEAALGGGLGSSYRRESKAKRAWTSLAAGLLVKQEGAEPRFQPSHPRVWCPAGTLRGCFRHQQRKGVHKKK